MKSLIILVFFTLSCGEEALNQGKKVTDEEVSGSETSEEVDVANGEMADDELEKIFGKSVLKESDLSPGDIDILETESVKEFIGGLRFVYSGFSKDGEKIENDGGDDSCFLTSLVDHTPILGDNFFTISGVFDTTSCENGENEEIAESSVEFRLSVACAGDDFSVLEDLSSREVLLKLDELSCGTTYLIREYKETTIFRNKELDIEYPVIRVSSTYGSKFGSTCKILEIEDETYQQSCTSTYMLTDGETTELSTGKILDDLSNRTSLFWVKKEVEVVMSSGKGPFKSSGKFEFTLNGWKGSSTLLGEATSPLWKMSKGTKNISGSFSKVPSTD